MQSLETLKRKALAPFTVGVAVLGLASCASANQQQKEAPEAIPSSSMQESDLLEFFKAEADNFADCTPAQMPEGILELTEQTTDSLTEYNKGLSGPDAQKTLEDLVQSNIEKINSTSMLLGDSAKADTQLAYIEDYGRIVLQTTENKKVSIYSYQTSLDDPNSLCLVYKISVDVSAGSSAKISFKMGKYNGEYTAKNGGIATKITPTDAATMTVIAADLKSVIPKSADITVLPGGKAPVVPA